MRPHRLRLQAFGPFAGSVEVDLDALATSGLFLLHGETGAGKTTLLDGLGFALYGRVPGVRGKTGRLRSDHADPAVRTEVELDVTLGGRRWRITRSPAQERAKARGTGTTTEQARVHLQEHRDGGWVSVSTRIEEAAAELDPLLGMSSEQFFQVVLLPQGEFARFLRADSKERGELLQRLFATERFKAVEDWLVARRVSTGVRLAAARQQLEVLAGRLAQAAGELATEMAAAQVDAEQGLQLLDGARVRRAAAMAAVVAAESRRDDARRQALEQNRLAERQQRRRAALTTSAQLELDEPAQVALQAQLRAAARAAELSAVLDEAAARDADHPQAAAAEAASRALLAAVAMPLDADPALLRSTAEQARRRSGHLDALRDVARAHEHEQELVAAASRDVQAADRALEELARSLGHLPARRAQAMAAVLSARAAGQELPDAQARCAVLTGALVEARGLQLALDRAAGLHEEHLLARETHVSLREKEGELREARLVTMVAELADRLVPDAPCEVCGSTDHPDPYEGDGDGVTRDDEDRARLQAEQAGRVVADLEAQLAAATATAQGHRARLVAVGVLDDGVAGLEHEVQAVTRRVAGLGQLAAGLDEALAEQQACDHQQAEGVAGIGRLEVERGAAQRRLDEARRRAQGHQGQLDAELAGAPDLATALSAAAALVLACESVLLAAERTGRAGSDAVRSAGAAVAGALAAGFADPVAAVAAARTPTWRADAEQRRRAHDDRLAASAATLADPELQVPLEPAADPAAAAALLADTDEALGQARGVQARVQGQLTDLERLVPELVAAHEALVPLEVEAGQARRLADLCAGGGANALKMTLTSFVLAARLEQVAQAASGRLLRMSQGRYSLVHTDGAAKGGARTGLGLLARDSWTGQDRDTSTLSGGETFLASLSLALGLADVVQAEAGGTRIEALFVDEGFGTLDEETLDEVMDVLDGLREGGRLVGLVSHVAELKARIPAQVRVVKTRRGSTLELLGC